MELLNSLYYEKKEGIGYVILNRGDKHNPMSRDLLIDSAQAFRALRFDPEVQVIIYGANGKSFCAGADQKDPDRVHHRDEGYEGWRDEINNPGLFDLLWRYEKPIIAAIHGYVLGGGAELAMFSDIVVAAENTQFGEVQITNGILPIFLGGRLARAVGDKIASELLLTGRVIDADEAYRIGIVSKVVPLDKLMDAAEAYAKRLLSLPALAIRTLRQAIRHEGDLTWDQLWYVNKLTDWVVVDSDEQIKLREAFVDPERRKHLATRLWKGVEI